MDYYSEYFCTGDVFVWEHFCLGEILVTGHFGLGDRSGRHFGLGTFWSGTFNKGIFFRGHCVRTLILRHSCTQNGRDMLLYPSLQKNLASRSSVRLRPMDQIGLNFRRTRRGFKFTTFLPANQEILLGRGHFGRGHFGGDIVSVNRKIMPRKLLRSGTSLK